MTSVLNLWFYNSKNNSTSQENVKMGRVCMPKIPAPEKQRQDNHNNFEASLVYKVSSREIEAICQDPVINKQTHQQAN